MCAMAATTTPAPQHADEDVEYVPGVAYPRVAALVLVAVVLAVAVTYWLTRPGTPGDPSTVDTGFVMDMRTHHQQAVEMSLLELGNGENPVVIGFAREILVRQNVELGLMAAELDDWGIDVSTRPDNAMGWMGSGVPYEQMPGLATDEQMVALRNARGADADALFLELMAEHHRGGIHMATYAAEHARTDDVRDLAAAMAPLQAMEINEFRDTAEREGLDAEITPHVAGEDPFAHG
jgi:uncharacterized protein (DUF305 family)